MEYINTKAIEAWFENLPYSEQIELSSKYLNHSNVEMLNMYDIVIIYVNYKSAQ